MKLHFIGIGGIGMKGVAEIAKAKGHIVTGSDLKNSLNVKNLREKGIEVFNEHSKENVKQVNAIVISGAIDHENPEVKQAKLLNIPIWTRMQALDRLLHGSGQRISVIGSCGKTSAVAILESVFRSGVIPTVYMGDISKTTGESGYIGDGNIAIVESCEYKGAFFDFRTDNIVLTDIVSNHENCFGIGTENVSKVFVNYIESSLATKVFLPVDVVENEPFKYLLNDNRVVTYGIGSGNWRADIISENDFVTTFKVEYNKTKIGEFTINLPGEHLVKHAIPAIALATELGLGIDDVKQGLLNARLPNRRFDVKYKSEHYIGIDDNARNPSQVEKTISTISKHLPNHQVIVVLGVWGHLNPRPISEFAKVLRDVECVMISELGRAAQSMGGAEDDNAIQRLIFEFEYFGVNSQIWNNEMEVYNKVNDLLKNGPVVLLTVGYNSYSEKFSKIHDEIILKL